MWLYDTRHYLHDNHLMFFMMHIKSRILQTFFGYHFYYLLLSNFKVPVIKVNLKVQRTFL